MGTYITFPELLIWLPLAAGLACFFIKSEVSARKLALVFSLLVLGISVASLFYTSPAFKSYNVVNYYWLKYIGNSFFIGIDGTSRLLALLTAVSMPLILLASSRYSFRKGNYFYGLMMLTQSGLMGVFFAMDALVFYFFWELALIPVYFLSSIWGGPRRIQATFKFFIYTFVGSLLMLIGILYVYTQTPGRMFEDGTNVMHSFSIASFRLADLNATEQGWLFVLFFLAFAVKMPVFPFHTWQPEAYEQAPMPVTMLLSSVMVKMGLFGLINWLIPMFPEALPVWRDIVIGLAVFGIVYASCLALVQDNLRKLVAYSSIAHIGLMCAVLFTMNETGVQGVMIQMFNHGVNILGLWIVLGILEQKTGVSNISQLGGVAQRAPRLTVFLLIIGLANIALPLTNAFAGELLMLGGLFQYNKCFALAAGSGVILAAVYMLNMIRRVFFGNTVPATESMNDAGKTESFVLAMIVIMIFVAGVYPESLMKLGKMATSGFLQVNV